MAAEVTRHIKWEVQRELWGRAAGRCEFDGCNRPVFKSPVTQERVNISEQAHIYSFSKDGPRGWGPLVTNKKALNEIENLMLVCHDCHKKIDQATDGGRYTADLLKSWKKAHEERIAIVTGVHESKKSVAVLYGANIGNETSPLRAALAHADMFPDHYPSAEQPIELGMVWEGKDREAAFWDTEEKNLVTIFERRLRPELGSGQHFSVFALAPIPLLVRLGALLTDKVPCRVHQLQREPKQSWRWSSAAVDCRFVVQEPDAFTLPPALVMSLSGTIAPTRVFEALGHDAAIWSISIAAPHNDFLKTEAQLSAFREAMRKMMVRIAECHGRSMALSIFPAIPVAAAVELGRIRMPKADMPWVLYDHNNHSGAFVKALTIGGN